MTPLTDDRIVELLRDTYAAHEDLADPTGLELPTEPAPRRQGLVLVGLVAAAALVAGFVVSHTGAEPQPPPSRDAGHAYAPPVAPVSDAANRARTRAVADRLLAEVPLLPNGTEVGEAPIPGLRTGVETIDPSLNTITRTSWWTGPPSVAGAVAYYLAHPPHGLVASDGGTSSDGRTVLHEVQYADQRPNPAYATRYLLLSVARDGNGVAVRADTFVNWRPARSGSSLVGGNVTAIVARVLRSRVPGDPTHLVRRGTVTDPSEIARVVKEVNGWYGEAPVTSSCPLQPGPVTSYTLRFRTGYGPVVMRGAGGCGGGVQVIRRGESVAPVLDAAAPFGRLVRRLTH